MSSFDDVFVGGGLASCVLATRLSEDSAVTVARMEAGPTGVSNNMILKLTDQKALLDSGFGWDYVVEPNNRDTSFLRHTRANVLGECSS